MVSSLFYPLNELEPSPLESCDVVFLSFIAPASEFELDKEGLNALLTSNKPVIIFDHTEVFPSGFILGENAIPSDQHGYWDFNDAIKFLTVKAYFKRELPVTGCYITGKYPVYPIDWTMTDKAPKPTDETEQQYNERPIDIFMSWGYSSESRPRLYGELVRRAGEFGAHFCLNEYDVTRALMDKRQRIFALLFSPYYRRTPFGTLLQWQQLSKVSVSLFGAGKKCFRCAEASHNSLMAQQSPEEVTWSYPWVSNKNCIGLPNNGYHIDEGLSVTLLYQWLRMYQGSLYGMYKECIENAKNYRNGAYARNYLLPKIMEAMK